MKEEKVIKRVLRENKTTIEGKWFVNIHKLYRIET